MKTFTPLAFIALILALTFAMYYFPTSVQTLPQPDVGNLQQTQSVVITPTPTPTASPSYIGYVPKIEGNVYQLEVTKLENTHAGAMQLLETRGFYFYNTITTRNPYGLKENISTLGNRYWIVTKEKLQLGKVIKKEQSDSIAREIEATVVEHDDSLLPYLENPKFCKVNTDCVIRYDYCKKGAWNAYSAFHEGTDCWFGTNEGQPEDIVTQLNCPTLEFIVRPIIGDYSGVKCENNACVAQNPTFRCIKDQQEWFSDGGGFQ